MIDGSAAVDEGSAQDLYLSSGNEAGTAPEDRRFRPDVEGLRAVAVLLVVLYHAGVPGLSGGFVGVDVFFVISGFVITGLLLRERTSTGATSLLHFYARRCRRILPAATLVIVVAVAASYVALGVVTGANTAGDGRWAAVFLANFHFESIGTNYLLALRSPSPLQNFWSLSVEEQFYIVYPTIFLVMAKFRGSLSLRARLAIVLVPVIAASYSLSVVQTAHSPAAAYFSPFTRAWELALGALVAVGVPLLKQLPRVAGASLSWLGFAAILFASFVFSASTPYPGSLVAVPVVGAALVIAGGVGAPRWGTELLLKVRPAQWLGRLSYSLYLWHWPILVIAAQYARKSQLPVWQNLGWVLVAVALSIGTYRLVENPVRHSGLGPRQSVLLGAILVVATLLLLTFFLTFNVTEASGYHIDPVRSSAVQAELVAAAPRIKELPHPMIPPLNPSVDEFGGSLENNACASGTAQTTERICVLGDRQGKNLLVVYGDSHALMWLPAFLWIAQTAHWRLVVLSKPYCPAIPLTIANPPTLGTVNSPDVVCDKWHSWATRWINAHDPQKLVITQESIYRVPVPGAASPRWADASDWRTGLDALFSSLTTSRSRTVILGNAPVLPQPGPQCLAANPSNVQACSSPATSAVQFSNQVEQSTAGTLHIGYINTVPWFCSSVCTAVIGKYNVYLDGAHINASFASYLEVLLGQALHL